jgi:DtxR family Mn-dependent transcriptional regulator
MSENAEITLDQLPVGAVATIVKILASARKHKKFADIGLVPGTELQMQSHAPFGGLLRIKLLDSSMALHRKDAAGILLRREA